jgi:hypothetical protein
MTMACLSCKLADILVLLRILASRREYLNWKRVSEQDEASSEQTTSVTIDDSPQASLYGCTLPKLEHCESSIDI